MAIRTESHDVGCSGTNCLECGALDPQELSVFSTLIKCRRPLPIYLGDTWRCDACQYECADVAEMENHIIEAHEPEPMNTEDWEELLDDDPATDR